ncbi:MAG: S8 family serine peptidase [Chitinophagaceae bacterium]
MKTKLIVILAVLFLFSFQSNAQKFYYSKGKKVFLSEDTTSISIKGKTINSYKKLASVLGVNSNLVFDTVSLKDVAVIRFSSSLIKDQITNLLKADTNVLYLSNLFKGGNIPFIPTGEILLATKDNITTSVLLQKLQLTSEAYFIKESYGIKVLKVLDIQKIFDVANKIYESDLVKWSHPNFFVPIEHFTNDPLYTQQFYLKNTGQGGGTAGIDINVENAWNITKGNSSIKIAVIDDGVEDHEDLSGRVLSGYTPRDQTSGNGRPTNAAGTGHGEACAGIIAATQDNNIGIAGIAPNCMIVPVNIFYGGETTLDLSNAINWAWNQGQADVLSNSWGYGTSSQTETGFDAIIQAIYNARTQGRNGKGSVVVFASGNGSTSVSFPANVQDVITVGAIQKTGTIWGYSNTGQEMDVVTVSGNTNLLGDITTTDRMGSLGYETGNYTNTFGGTSAACPQVSGVAALVLSVNSTFTEAQVRTLLQNTATDMGAIGFDNSFGFGRVNACAAVIGALTISGDNSFCTSSNNYSIPNLPSGATVTWSANPTNVVNITCPTCPQTTLTVVNDGIVNLTATISACGAPFTIDKTNIQVRFPFSETNTIVSAEDINISVSHPPEFIVNAYRWYMDGVFYRQTTAPLLKTTLASQCHDWSVSFVTTCGESPETYPISVGCGNGVMFVMSPNPATNNVTIDGRKKNKSIKEVQIIDKLGNVKRVTKYSGDQKLINLDISGLPSDIYFIKIYDGQKWESKQLSVQ